MDAISDWFKGSKDYTKGVALYASLPTSKTQTLKRLNRGKNGMNMSMLVSELRKHVNKPTLKVKRAVVIEKPKNPNQDQIDTKMNRVVIAQESQKTEFDGVRLGDLPADLRPRFMHARTVFYYMIELKFALNDLPDADHDAALALIVQITELDEERDLIWKELHHYKKHGTLLTVPEDDFSQLSPVKLLQKKNNLKSNISKITKRINLKYDALENEPDGHNKLLLEAAIRKSEQKLHTHEVNMKKIDLML